MYFVKKFSLVVALLSFLVVPSVMADELPRGSYVRVSLGSITTWGAIGYVSIQYGVPAGIASSVGYVAAVSVSYSILTSTFGLGVAGTATSNNNLNTEGLTEEEIELALIHETLDLKKDAEDYLLTDYKSSKLESFLDTTLEYANANFPGTELNRNDLLSFLVQLDPNSISSL